MIGIVICHKSLAYELVETTQAILGRSDDLMAFSNEKLTTDDAVKKIQTFIESHPNGSEVVFMTDLRGGNCWTIARIVSRNQKDMHVLSGVNLPMILSFMTKKDNTSISDLIEIIRSDALRGIELEQ